MGLNIFDIEQMVNGHVLPVTPPYPQGGKTSIEGIHDINEARPVDNIQQDKVEQTIFSTPMVVPLSIRTKYERQWWLLPVEPLISLSGSHTLVKRNVAKGKLRGSIKERWSQNDYTIKIDGLFTTPDSLVYPDEDIRRLRSILESKSPIEVMCPQLERFGIGRIAVENWDIPFTKGPENQTYSIQALSDDDWELFIKIDEKNGAL